MFRRMTRERYLSDDELERFMLAVRTRRHLHQPRDHAFFALLANTGMRPSEVLALHRADLHLEGRHPWVRVVRPTKKHGAKPLPRLFLNRAVARVVKKWTDHSGDRPFPFTKRQSARLFHYYCGKAAVPLPRKVYALRHTVGMKLWRHTHDIRLVQAVMGHVHQKAAAGYVHTAPEKIRSAYAAIGTVE